MLLVVEPNHIVALGQQSFGPAAEAAEQVYRQRLPSFPLQVRLNEPVILSHCDQIRRACAFRFCVQVAHYPALRSLFPPHAGHLTR